MSNLSELLPAGAGAKSADFVASGTLSSGQTVILKSDGTVSAVGEIVYTDGIGTENAITGGPTSNNNIVVYNSDDGTFIYLYVGSSSYPHAVIGTVSGTSISFGTPVVVTSTVADSFSAAYITGQLKFVFSFNDYIPPAYHHAVIVGSISGTTITFGTKNLHYGYRRMSENATCYDENADRVVIFARDIVDYHGTAFVGTITGTSISIGTPVVFENGTDPRFFTCGYMPNSQNVYVCYKNGSGRPTVRIGTVSGTSITLGSDQQYTTEQVRAGVSNLASAWNTTDNVLGIAYQGQTANYTKMLAATVSGTTVTYGSDVQLTSNSWDYLSVAYASAPNMFLITARDSTYFSYGSTWSFTVSGTTPTAVDYLIFNSAATYGMADGQSATFDASNNQFVIVYRDGGNSNYPTAVTRSVAFTTTNSANFIGITDQAIADTATGAVIVQGGVSDKVTGLTTGSDYYVQSNGTLSTTVSSVPAGRALSSTSILLEG